MLTPAIAAVIPAYNASRFINEAIDSVRAQTIAQWECVIVDDGSTDDTPSRLAAYRDSRIRSVRQDNSGECAARARGISLTRAPKIVFLDADDRLYPDTLARYVSFLDNHSAVGVAYGERTLINEEGRRVGFGWNALLNKYPQGDVSESILRRPFLSTPSQACLRREAVPPREWLGDRGPIICDKAACVPGSQPRPGSIIARSTAHRPETRRNRAHFAARTRRNFLSLMGTKRYKPELRTVNPQVPGSSPGRGAKFGQPPLNR